MKTHHPDKAVILHLGGPTKLADQLGFPRAGGVQRIVNWQERGIPAAVRLKHIDLFIKAEAELRAMKPKRPGKREAA